MNEVNAQFRRGTDILERIENVKWLIDNPGLLEGDDKDEV